MLCSSIALLSVGCAIESAGLGGSDGGTPPDASGRDAGANDAGTVDAPLNPIDGGSADAEPRSDATMPCEAFRARHFPACAILAPSEAVVVSTAETYDTTDGSGPLGPGLEIVQSGGVIARLVSLDALTITSSGTLRVVGSLPLIVASWSTIDIAGELDVSSALGGTAGAGEGTGDCPPATSGEYGTSGSGGGGGGGFRGRGGNGGAADRNNASLRGGLGGGTVLRPDVVRGGCRGADSGGTDRGAASGGRGGGAVQLTARDSIRIDGVVHAGGAAGAGGPTTSAAGGGGGGSGGYIGLEAAMVGVSGTLAANGGGGGEGTDRSLAGQDGEDGRPDWLRARGGGDTVSAGTEGGDGAASSVIAGADVLGTAIAGGGGGGGGAGFILIWSDVAADLSAALLSPPPMALPR